MSRGLFQRQRNFRLRRYDRDRLVKILVDQFAWKESGNGDQKRDQGDLKDRARGLDSGNVSKRVDTGLLPIIFFQAAGSETAPGGPSARRRFPCLSLVVALNIVGVAQPSMDLRIHI